MTTATATAKPKPVSLPRKPPGHHRGDNIVSMSISIGSVPYRCRILPTPDAGCSRTIRLGKEDGTRYHVSRTLDGAILCDCESATYRPATICKHGRALIALGLHDAPVIADEAPLEPSPRRFTPPPCPPSLADDPGLLWKGTSVRVDGEAWFNFDPAPPRLEAIPSGGVLAHFATGLIRHYHGRKADLLNLAVHQWHARKRAGE